LQDLLLALNVVYIAFIVKYDLHIFKSTFIIKTACTFVQRQWKSLARPVLF